jgi:UDP-N-acetylmuramoyl-tripeptide--D-alanyl-D-alanine ligase
MGMRGLGHIAYLCEIAKPTIGVVTNVGLAHVGEVGSIENIALAKSELVKSLDSEGIAILNADDPRVMAMSKLSRGNVITFGKAANSDVLISNIQIHRNGTSSFDLSCAGRTEFVELPLLGEHNISNSAAAAAVGIALGMQLDVIANALSEATVLSKWRMEVHELAHHITLINDAYNANPESMRAAFTTLRSYTPHRTTWAVIAGMHELGDSSESEHAALGQFAADCGISHLVIVGDLARPALETALSAGVQAVWFPEINEASDYIGQKVAADNVLLFKASRSEGLERLAALVMKQIERGAQQ